MKKTLCKILAVSLTIIICAGFSSCAEKSPAADPSANDIINVDVDNKDYTGWSCIVRMDNNMMYDGVTMNDTELLKQIDVFVNGFSDYKIVNIDRSKEDFPAGGWLSVKMYDAAGDEVYYIYLITPDINIVDFNGNDYEADPEAVAEFYEYVEDFTRSYLSETE